MRLKQSFTKNFYKSYNLKGGVLMIYLDHAQVRAKIKEAESEDETIVIRCIRKGKASKVGGPDEGDVHTLVCGRKPNYTPVGKPSCEESLYQRDSVQEALPDLAEAVCSIVGYHKHVEEE
jgi:hypothetical protein